MQETINKLDYITSSINLLNNTILSSKEAIPHLEDKINSIDETLNTIAESKEYWRKAIDVLYEKSIGELNERLNTAINFIFYDKDLSISLELDDKRGKSLSIILKNDNGEEISVKDGCGHGIRNVISFVIHSFYLHSKGSKILMVDEKYSNISAEYLPRFSEFAKKFCKATGMSLILITHDPRFNDLAQRKYLVQNGEIIEVEN